MKKTLLLVFIHGFKGGDDTFGNFPEHMRMLLSRALPAVSIATAVYPKYETRGSLQECVSAFREWLQNRVIDLEVSNRTPSPTVDPSVHVFLVGHSMGGIVAAETLLLLASEQPIAGASSSSYTAQSQSDISPTETSVNTGSSSFLEPSSFMFPHIQGVFAFDTPYLGIAPGVVSYGAEEQYKNVTSTYSAISEVAGLFGFGASSSSASSNKDAPPQKELKKALPPASDDDAAATPSWQRWGRYAMFAGAAGAVAAGGAAAMYSQRQRLTDGWGWVSSHLAFVGCLARPAELRQRLSRLAQVEMDRGIRCMNFYTCLGQNVPPRVDNSTSNTHEEDRMSFSSKIIRSKYRTFCSLPAEEEGQEQPSTLAPGLAWIRAVNDGATDEIKAHTCMFLPKENPGFDELMNNSCTAMARSVDKGWYATATGIDEDITKPQAKKGQTQNQPGCRSTDLEDDVVVLD
ncbi:hypothetical protein P175DRAFT_0491144 [Aspergillus ochraceoroseus IBT 24754]|uniref:DUF676 domain-containing protein n=2 Tax=Aspergillus ochraceoroseus TaxID=138278 RepID=A0A2T5M2F4_9EURO|nr:uncharacterized protein P175DRAFT_0491144 [Aspergillus ochraceoroseus IBT 24754]KKK22122.1 hypothetical protein AOCH_005585 [Aspergillus ochraceoroseus]PTU22712.1 hypothetical protein P175DRAFT_0491144 [Aspergillus ochraceoroseus IBT 24754]